MPPRFVLYMGVHGGRDMYLDKEEYAVSTFSFLNAPLDVALEHISRSGFSWVEIWGDAVHADPRAGIHARTLASMLKRHALKLHSLHLPFRNMLLRSSPKDSLVYRMQVLHDAIDLCARIECSIAVIHPLDRNEYNYGYDAVAMLHDLFEHLSAYADAHNVALAMENIPSQAAVPQEIRCTIDELNTLFGDIPTMKWCLDIGHVAVTGHELASEIKAAGKRLASCHVHNNDGKHDSHDLPDQGIIDWPGTYSLLRNSGYTGRFVFEVAGGAHPSEIIASLSTLFDQRRNV
ncbi:MAG: sugar phosphate isomerase/epimerase [Sphaerochaetaceae bacterium]|nr:sugar phosphate isomerase/epimerase [Sphaerochaetaceae bacterium]